jgi:glycerol-3-phosphate cytidylyltransferase-like family protein
MSCKVQTSTERGKGGAAFSIRQCCECLGILSCREKRISQKGPMYVPYETRRNELESCRPVRGPPEGESQAKTWLKLH